MPHILVIEDEKRVADLLQMGLEESGYQVTTADNGISGLRLFLSEKFDLVISDIILPKMEVSSCVKKYARIIRISPY